MKVLVIGGCGFIGSHIVDRLLRDGHEVRILTLGFERFRSPLDTVDYRIGDFLQPETLATAISGVDAVFHVASTTFPATADRNPMADVRENLLGTMGIVEAMLGLGVRRLMFMSSGGTVYGVPETVPIREDHPLRPINSYGIVKAAIENFIEHYGRTRGLAPVVIRASNPVGTRQYSTGVQGVVATFIDRIAAGEPLEIWGDGTVVRDFIDVEDLAELCVRAGTSDRIGVYNAGSGSGTSMNELVEIVRSVTGRTVDVLFGPGRNIDVPVSILDSSKAHRDFGWKPKRELKQSIENAWTWATAEAARLG
jgi:UDP-glucose 4-epimerase